MSGGHALAKRKSVKKKDLVDEVFVVYAANSGDSRQIDVLRNILGKEPV